MGSSRLSGFVLAVAILLIGAMPALAETVTIQNKWTEIYLAGDRQGLSETQDANDPATRWVIEDVPGTDHVHLRTADVGNYLYVDPAGTLRVGAADPTTPETQWRFEEADAETDRLQNVARQDLSIHNEYGPIEAGPIESNWWSAM